MKYLEAYTVNNIDFNNRTNLPWFLTATTCFLFNSYKDIYWIYLFYSIYFRTIRCKTATVKINVTFIVVKIPIYLIYIVR